MKNKNLGESHPPKELKPMNHQTGLDERKKKRLSLDSIVASTREPKEPDEDPAYENWNLNDLKPEEEDLQVKRSGNLKGYNLAQMQFEEQKRVQRFAPPKKRPLHFNSNSNVFREMIPNLDDLIETNEELKKD